jgi:hypothetical protein
VGGRSLISLAWRYPTTTAYVAVVLAVVLAYACMGALR